MPPHLHISVFGKLQIELNDQPIVGFVSSKVQALLCYLAVTDRPHTREVLATLLWGDMPDAEAKANLRNALSNLRKLVGNYLVTDRVSAAFNRDLSYRLDVAEFEAAISNRPTSEISLDALHQAVELYKGDFLAGFTVRDALDFEDWLLAQRERWRQAALQAFITLADGLTAQGDYPAAIDVIARLLTLEPTHEESYRRLMRLLARTGRRSEALARYEVCRQILSEQLGVEPAAETTALYNRLTAAATPSPHNLPAQLTPFVGRQKELAQISVRLDNPTCRLLTLVGPGGVGKTRLAVQAAGNCVQESRFRDGVFFVAPLTGASPQIDTLAAAVAAAIDFSPTDFTRPAVQLLAHLRGKEMLLLLDSMEQTLPPDQGRLVNWLLDALRQSPGLKLLITSQERLSVQEEWLLDVAGLDFPLEDTEPEQLARFGAVALFLQQAQQARPGFELTPTNAPFVAQICRLVGGLPLALELAAAWLRVSTSAEIVAEIEQSLDFLTSPLRNVPERHRSLRAVFDQSWQLLLEQEQVAMRRLSVFKGGFKRDAAREVTGASLPVLAGLVNKSLLRMNPTGRYEMHELLRQFATEKLAQFPEEQEATLNRHAHYYATFMEQWHKEFERDPSPEILAELNAEAANLRWGWQQAIEPDSAVDVNQYWYLGQFDRARHLAPAASGELRSSTPDWDQAQALHRQGLQAFYQGDYDTAQQHFTAALHLFAIAEDTVFAARAQVMLGQLAYLDGHDAEAERLLRQGVVGLKAVGDHRYRSYVLVNLAQITGEVSQAKTALEESLVLSRNIGSNVSTAHVLKNIGRLELALRQADRARRLFEESLALFRTRREVWGISSTLPLLGQAAVAVDDIPAAEQAFKEALRLALTHQFKPIMLEGLIGLAEARLNHEQVNPEVLTWLVLTATHPATQRDTREHAALLLAAVEDRGILATTEHDAGQPDALSTVVSKILDG